MGFWVVGRPLQFVTRLFLVCHGVLGGCYDIAIMLLGRSGWLLGHYSLLLVRF